MRRLLIVLLLAVVAGAGAFWWLTRPQLAVARADASFETGADAQRGRVVFFAGGCASCHAGPGQDDPLLLGGGLALPTDFGTFFAPNISPHPQAGIGGWTTADFINALRAGVSPQGTHYYPSFPYTSYARMTNEDARDLLAFIRTLEPVDQASRRHDLRFPFNVRRGLGLWKLVNLDMSPLVDDPARSAAWNRGRYLSEALSHCAECHSPRNFMGGIIERYRYAGGPNPAGQGWSPNITQSSEGIGDWSADDIALLLTTGMTPSIDVVGSSMAAVVKNMAELEDADVKAMAEFLKTIPAHASPERSGG